MTVLGARSARPSPVLGKGLRQGSPTATRSQKLPVTHRHDLLPSTPTAGPPPELPSQARGEAGRKEGGKRHPRGRSPAWSTGGAGSRPGPRSPAPDLDPRPPARASPCVCSAPQPQPQGPRERRRPARTRSDPKGRTHGRDAGCSSGRGGGAGAARSTAAAEPSARGTRRSRGSIAAADTCGCEGRTQALDPGPRAAGSPAPAGSTSAPAQCAREPPG